MQLPKTVASGHVLRLPPRVILNVDKYPRRSPRAQVGPRMVCNKRGMVVADVRPNWNEREK
jgi:hypothetical protein